MNRRRPGPEAGRRCQGNRKTSANDSSRYLRRLRPAAYTCSPHRACTHEFCQRPMTTNSDIAIALRTAYLALHRRSELRFAGHGVTADQFVLLATLARGQALAQRELARRMSSDPSTVRAMLVLLEERGLVERETHPTDARARTVALTAQGKRTFRKLWTA